VLSSAAGKVACVGKEIRNQCNAGKVVCVGRQVIVKQAKWSVGEQR